MNNLGPLLLPILLLLVFWVVVIRPSRARQLRMAQETRQTQAALAPGVLVMTTSGLYGRVAAVSDDTVDLEVSPGIVVRWAKAAVAEVKEPLPDDALPAEPGALDADSARPAAVGTAPVGTAPVDPTPVDPTPVDTAPAGAAPPGATSPGTGSPETGSPEAGPPGATAEDPAGDGTSGAGQNAQDGTVGERSDRL